MLLTLGCLSSNVPEANSAKAGSLPKLNFHRPKTLQVAVQRLRFIHDAVVSKQPLPDPLEFDVLEVIHGTGASAHSHYYLAGAEQEDDGHAGMDAEEKHHLLKVDVFTEFQDIINWLPKIAAATNEIDEQTWKAVKNMAAELANESRELGKSADVEVTRQAFRDRSESINEWIKELETELAKTSSTQVEEVPENG